MREFRVTCDHQAGQQFEERRQVPINPISANRGGTVSYGQKASMYLSGRGLDEDIFVNIYPDVAAYQMTEGLPLISEAYAFSSGGGCPLEKKGSKSTFNIRPMSKMLKN